MFASKDLLFTSPPAGYTINNSLRFRSSASAYLNRTFGTPTSATKWTWSGWVKRGILGNTQDFFTSQNISSTYGYIGFVSDQFYVANVVSGTLYGSTTSAVFRDPSSWYHIFVAVDTTQATAANRVLIYINGVSQTLTTIGSGYIPQNTNTQLNSAVAHQLGSFTAISSYLDGYLAEVNFIDGQALTPSSFGAYDATTGVWQPVLYTGTYGTNGFYLKFASFGTAAALGTDSSGNGNTWTVNNLSVTAGTTYDPMLDSPTLTSATVANYAVLNPLQNGGGTASAGNLNLLGASGTWGSRVSTIAPTSGKWYFEVTPTSGSATLGVMFGITKNTTPTSYLGADSNGYSYYGATGNKFNAGSAVAYGATVADNDIVGVAFDADAGSLTFYKNNVSQGVAYSGLAAGTWYLGVSCYSTATASINFGQRAFSYTPPSGFVALNAYNLPAPTITNGASYMAATTYTGTGAVQSISDGANTTTNVTFKPDLVWIKSRSAATNNNVFDSLRTATNYLITNSTAANATNANTLTAFNSTGFALGSDASSIGVNISTNTYVAWQWLAGAGTSSTNTNGSITSTVSVNATAGFSVVTYTGTGSAATVGHGLNAVPSFIIIKDRTAARTADQWPTYHVSIGATGGLVYLNSSGGGVASSVVWNNTNPTSSVFSLGNWGGINYSGDAFVAYCWSAVAGYSAFGSYTGNGSTDGVFIYTGFRPRFFMWKRTDTTGNWDIMDTSRDTYNLTGKQLYPNLGDAEFAGGVGDMLSNGFKFRDGSPGNNASGGTYIYAAFAENPFKYANAR